MTLKLMTGTGLIAALAATWTMATNAQEPARDPEAVERGQAAFEHTCAPCHGRAPGDDGRGMLPGTAALAVKYRGALPAALEDRQGLTAEVLKAFVRNGSWSMPPFRPTELTDAEIEDIAAYLDVTSTEAAASPRTRS